MGSTMHYRLGIGIMLVNAHKSVWVGKRFNTPDAWQMPQGGIDPEESAIQTLYRELHEETGIHAKDVTLIAESNEWITFTWPEELQERLWGGVYRGQRLKWFLLKLNADHDVTNLISEHPEFSTHKWANINDIATLIVDFKRPMYETIIKEFAWYFDDRSPD